jgi:hypothetical protein
MRLCFPAPQYRQKKKQLIHTLLAQTQVSVCSRRAVLYGALLYGTTMWSFAKRS